MPLLLVAMPCATSSFLLLVEMPVAASRNALVASSDALCYQ